MILGSVVCFEVGDGFAESWVDGLLKIGVEVVILCVVEVGKMESLRYCKKGVEHKWGFVVRSEVMECGNEIG